MLFLTETSAPVTDGGTTEVVKEAAFNLSQHIHDNIWAYGAALVVTLVVIGVIFLRNADKRAEKKLRKMKK